jgi:hypothetical protein
MHLLDAAKWKAAHDQEIDRHVSILKTWHYERPLPTDRPIPYTFTYKVKTDHPGQPSTYKARCTIRGDLMRSPGSLFVEQIRIRIRTNVPHPGQGKDSLVHVTLGHPCRACLQGLQGP